MVTAGAVGMLHKGCSATVRSFRRRGREDSPAGVPSVASYEQGGEDRRRSKDDSAT